MDMVTSNEERPQMYGRKTQQCLAGICPTTGPDPDERFIGDSSSFLFSTNFHIKDFAYIVVVAL